jgi:hypothetical protein
MLRSRHTSVTTADIGCVWIASTLAVEKNIIAHVISNAIKVVLIQQKPHTKMSLVISQAILDHL